MLEGERSLAESVARRIEQESGIAPETFEVIALTHTLLEHIIGSLVSGKVLGNIETDPATGETVFQPLLTAEQQAVVQAALSHPFLPLQEPNPNHPGKIPVPEDYVRTRVLIGGQSANLVETIYTLPSSPPSDR